MPKRVQLPDGNLGEFPDSMPDAQIEAVLQKQFPQPKSVSPPVPPDWRDALTRIDPHQSVHSASDLGREVVRGVGNIGAGGLGVLLRPVATVEGIGESIAHPIETAKNLYKSATAQPLETAESMVGQAGAMGAAGEASGGVARVVPPAFRKGLETITKTTPKETAELVKKTQEENAASTATAAEKNAVQAAKRTQQVQQHFEKTQAAKEANEVSQNARDRKIAIERGVEHLDPEIKSELESTEKRINAEANKKYTDLRSVLKDEQADPYQAVDEEGHVKGNPVSMVEHLYDVANEPLRGTETETPIIKSLGKRTENGEVDLTYNDLQGYREEVGRELRKGSLPPDVFTAYKRLLTGIDDAMDQIAARKGLKPQQDAARAYYRQYAETFIDRDSPVRKAIDATERGQTIKQFGGKDQTGVEQIAKYDPALARRINTIRGYQSEARGIRPSTAPPKEALPLPPKPTPIIAKVSDIGPEDVRAAKTESLTKRAEAIRNKGGGWANTFVILDAIRNAIHGNMAGIGSDLAVRGIFGVGKQGIANLLERPEVVKFLTEPTAKDIAQIPPELRRDFGPIAKAAQARGIKVSPKLLALSAVATPRHPTLSPASPVQ